MTEPLVTALVSTYASARFLRGCLEDLLAQTIADRLEIVVVDACSPEDEGAIVREFQRHHQNIRYVRTAERERTSASFNRGTAMARGRYLTTANTDDRHHPAFLERLCAVLEQEPTLGLVYADSAITHTANETWQQHSAARRYAWPDYTHTTALSCCLFGAQPVWRRSAHDRAGLWDEQLHFANDQDMFLRIAQHCGAVHLAETLGLFLMRADSTSGADNRQQTLADVLTVLRRHRTAMPLEVLFPGLATARDRALAHAAACIEMGNLCALGPYTDGQLALDFYRRALDAPLDGKLLPKVRRVFANNTACVLAAGGMRDDAGRAFALAGDLPEAVANRAHSAIADGGAAELRDLQFASLPHDVVTASRSARSVRVDTAGRVRWSEPREQEPWQVYDGPNGVPFAAGDALSLRPHKPPSPRVVALPSLPARPHDTPQNVVIVMYGWADSGGGTMLPRQFALQLAASGSRVTVFYAVARPMPQLPPYAEVHGEENGVRLVGIANRPSLFMDLAAPAREVDDPTIRARFAALLDAVEPDVVHFWNLHNLGMSLPGECRSRDIPTVLSSNNYWPICPRLYLVDPVLERCSGGSVDGQKCARCTGAPRTAGLHAERRAAGIAMLRTGIDVHLAVSNRVRDLYVANGEDPAHVRVLRQEPGEVATIWARTGARRTIVERLQRPLRVAFVGSLLPHKGARVLAEALQLLPTGSVAAVALGDQHPEYAALLRQIDGKGVLHLHGRYAPAMLPELLGAVDVVVVPSLWDDCAPFVVAEALAARAPVLGSAIGGIPDFVRDGHNGLLFAPGDVAGLAAALRSFAADPTLLGRLQRGIEPPRGLAAFADDVRGVYRELLAAPLVGRA